MILIVMTIGLVLTALVSFLVQIAQSTRSVDLQLNVAEYKSCYLDFHRANRRCFKLLGK
jgi:hypothetical protein